MIISHSEIFSKWTHSAVASMLVLAYNPKQSQLLLRCALSEAHLHMHPRRSPLHDSQTSFRQSSQAREQMQFDRQCLDQACSTSPLSRISRKQPQTLRILNDFAAYSGPQTIPFIGVGALLLLSLLQILLLLAWKSTILCLYSSERHI